MYIICPYCGTLQEEPHGCEWNGLTEEGDPLYCYSCGKEGQVYAKSQWTKPKPRCKTCVAEERKERHEPFARQAFEGPEEDFMSKALMKAVEKPDLKEVKALLAKGADPNYHRLAHRFI